jgi:hypothetical protein
MSTVLRHRTTALLAMLAAIGTAATASQATFSSPEAAASALVSAVRSGDYPLFLAIAGSPMSVFWNSGDELRDAIERDRFLDAAGHWAVKPDAGVPGRKLLYVGAFPQPFPAPLIYTGSAWRFDGDAGLAELTARSILRNEDAIVERCRLFRDAQFLYHGANGDGGPVFPSAIRSTPGKHDGLFWSGDGEDDESPLGPPFAAAAYAERLPGEQPRPLFGYYIRILTAQGPDALGGELDYRAGGVLRGGFALIAWPAVYGVDGFRSFLINRDGDVYQKDLGPDTSRVAGSMAAFNPDRSWRKIDE